MKNLVLLSLLTMSIVSSASATTFIMTTEEERIQQSDRISAVKVIEVRSERGSRLVMTRAKVKPIECFLDETTETFDVLYPGGEIERKTSQGKTDRQITRIPGAPQLKVDQNLILFLKAQPKQKAYAIHSWLDGILPLKWNELKKEFELARPTSEQASKRGSRQKANLSPSEKDPASLAAFRERVAKARSK